jgi:hypothetical protein
MLFALYNEDDGDTGPRGSIHQSNKVYHEPDAYHGVLKDHGHKYVTSPIHGPVSPMHFMVDVDASQLVERPLMPVTVSKTTIKAGGNDSVVFKNIPKGAVMAVTVMNIPIHGEKVDTADRDFATTVPGLYRVAFDLWPFRRFEIDIEAVQ